MPSIKINWSTNTEELRNQLKLGLQQIEATKASAEALARSLSGDNLIRAAHNYAAAVSKIGDVSKLTAANQERVNSVMTKAVEVLTAAGKGGSDLAKHFQSLADQTKQVESAQSGWLSTLKALGGSFVARVAEGVLLRDAIHGILSALHSATVGLAEELAALTLHGAGVADVEENYQRLTKQAGLLGTTLLGTLRAGTHNTIDDFALMKTVNQDLAAGLKLTDSQFATLAKGAFALAQATGTDVKGALDTMNDAMLTGRTRALALLTGKIDLTKAENDFAKTLGTTADHLSEEGKLEAARVAILKAVGDATERLGEQTDGLDEKVAQAQVSWTNFKDELGKVIATSTVLGAGLDGLQAIISETFGGNQKSVFDGVAHAIEDLEIKIVEFSKVGVEGAGALLKEYYALKKLFGDLLQVIDLAKLASAIGVLPGQADAGQALALIKTIKERGAALQDTDAAQQRVDASVAKLNARLDELKGKMQAAQVASDAARKATAEFVGPLQDEGDAARAAAQATADHTKFLQQSTAEKSKAKAAAEKLAEVERELASLNADYRDTLKGIEPALIAEVQGWLRAGASIEQLTVKYPQLTKAQLKAVGELDKALDETLKSMDRFEDIGVAAAQAVGKSFAGMPKVLRELSQSLGDVNLDAKTLPVTGALIGTTFEQSAEKIRAAMTKGAQSFLSLNEEQRNTIDLMHALGFTTEEIAKTMGISIDVVKTHVFSLGQSIKTTLEGIPDLLIQALLGGGGISGAFKALGVQLGRDFAEGIQEGIKKSQASQKAGGSAINATTTWAGAGAGGLAGAGAEASGASGRQAAGTVALTAVSIGTQVGIHAGSWAAGAAAGGATLGIGLGVVAAIEIYKAKHKAQWEKLGIDIGNAFGVQLSKETLKAWEKESKVFGRQATGILHLDEIIAAAGGIAKFGFEKAAKGAHDLFSMVQTGQLSVAQATQELDKLWPELAKGGTDAYGRINDKLKELIALNAQYKTDSKEIAAFLRGQAQTLVGGVNATTETLGTADKDKTTFEAIGQRVADAKKLVDDLTKAGKTGTREWTDATEELAKAQKRQGEYAEANKQTLDDLASQALIAYAAAKATGATDAEALAAVGPSLAILRESYKGLGLDIEDAGVKALLMQDTILNGTDKLGAGIAGLNAQFVTLDNLNLLDQAAFESLERIGLKMFERLEAKAIENGGTQKDALVPMQQFLHEAEDAAKKYGYQLDAATQHMIDLSKETGVWKDEDPTATLEGGLKELIKTVKELINTLRGIPNEIPDPTRNWQPPPTWREGDDPNAPAGWRAGDDPYGTGSHPPMTVATGGIIRSWGVQRFDTGGRVLPFIPRGSDTVPAMLTPGEWVFNDAQQQALAGLLQDGATAARALVATGTSGFLAGDDGRTRPAPVNLVLEVDGREIGRTVWDPTTMSGDNRQKARLQVQQMVREQ